MAAERKDEARTLAARAEALRSAIARAQIELNAASVEERAISERLAQLEDVPTTRTESVVESSGSPTDAVSTSKRDKQGTQNNKDAETVVVLTRLTQRDVWKVALAGAAAATVLAAIGLTVHHEIVSSSSSSASSASPAWSSAATTTTPAAAGVVVTPPGVATANIENELPGTPFPVGTVIGASPHEVRPPPSPPTTIRRRPISPPTAHERNDGDVDNIGPSGVAIGPSPATTTRGMGALTVVCLPKCDQIIDNGEALGPGHIFNRPRPAGRHTLVLTSPNGVRKTRDIEIAPEQTREIRITMDSATTTSASRPANCSPPYFVDENGHKHYRPECLNKGEIF